MKMYSSRENSLDHDNVDDRNEWNCELFFICHDVFNVTIQQENFD